MQLLIYILLIISLIVTTIIVLRRQRARLIESRAKGENLSALRVLFINRDLEFAGGVPRCLLHFARAYDRRKLAYHLASLDAPSTLMVQEFEKLNIKPVGLGARRYLRPGLRMRKMILERGIDTIVATSFRAYICSKIATLGLGRQNVGVIFWLHAVQGPVSGPIRRAILWFVGPLDPMLFVSNAVRDAHLPAVHFGHSQVIYNGVEDHQGNPEFELYDPSRRAEFGLPQDALLLANTGEFLHLKDHATLIRATHELVRRGVNAHLMLIGTGELLDNLHRIAKVGPATANIHFLGMRPDARRLLGLADMYVHGCSVEGFGLAVVEAMLSARPVVVPRGGAVMEYIADGKNGAVFNPADPASLAGVVMKLAADPQRSAQIAKTGREYCLRVFAAEQWGQSVVSFIEKVQPAAVARRRNSPAITVNAESPRELSCVS